MGYGQGYNTTIAFSSGFFAKIVSISITGPNLEALDITHLLSPDNRMEFTPNILVNAGEVTVVCHHDSALAAPINNPSEAVTIGWPDAHSLSASGFMTSYDVTADAKTRRMATVKIKFTGLEVFS